MHKLLVVVVVVLAYNMRASEFLLETMVSSKVGQVVPELHAALMANKAKILKVKNDKKKVYKIIDGLMTSIALAHNVSRQRVHDLWVKKYKEIPDTWIMNK